MKKKLALALSFLLIFTLVFTACGSKNAADSITADMAESAPQASSVPMEKPKVEYDYSMTEDGMFAEESMDIYQSVDSAIYTDPNAKIIRSAQLTIQTTEFDKSVGALAELTEKQGGYYETAQVDGGSYYNQYANRSAYFVVRIPKANFVAFRDSVSSVGHLLSISEDTKNVGEEYYDTEARLATLKTKHERLLALLDKAELMEDIISLESALADVQYQIDMYNTTLRKYDSLIDYSTFTIHMNEVVEIKEDPGPQESFGTKLMASLKDGFSDFANAMESFAYWFARNVITLVILAVIIVVIVKVVLWRIKKRRSKRNEVE